jgi:hypothetical protein
MYNTIASYFQRPGIAFNPAFNRMLHPIQATRNNRLKDKMFHPPVKLVFDRFTASSHKFSLSLVSYMPFLHSIHSWAANLLHCPSPLHHSMRTLPLPFFNSPCRLTEGNASRLVSPLVLPPPILCLAISDNRIQSLHHSKPQLAVTVSLYKYNMIQISFQLFPSCLISTGLFSSKLILPAFRMAVVKTVFAIVGNP